jgi:hypothetical protein
MPNKLTRLWYSSSCIFKKRLDRAVPGYENWDPLYSQKKFPVYLDKLVGVPICETHYYKMTGQVIRSSSQSWMQRCINTFESFASCRWKSSSIASLVADLNSWSARRLIGPDLFQTWFDAWVLKINQELFKSLLEWMVSYFEYFIF